MYSYWYALTVSLGGISLRWETFRTSRTLREHPAFCAFQILFPKTLWFWKEKCLGATIGAKKRNKRDSSGFSSHGLGRPYIVESLFYIISLNNRYYIQSFYLKTIPLILKDGLKTTNLF